MPARVRRAGPAPTARRRSVSKNARTEENASRRTRASASTAGSTPIARRPFARRRVVMVAIVPDLIPAPAPRNGVEKTAAHPYVNRNARTAVGAWHQIPASACPSGTGTIVGCLYVIKVNLRPTGRRRPGLASRRATLRSVSMYGRGPGPCIDRVFSKNGVMRPKVLIVRNRNELIRSWRPSPVRTIST